MFKLLCVRALLAGSKNMKVEVPEVVKNSAPNKKLENEKKQKKLFEKCP